MRTRLAPACFSMLPKLESNSLSAWLAKKSVQLSGRESKRDCCVSLKRKQFGICENNSNAGLAEFLHGFVIHTTIYGGRRWLDVSHTLLAALSLAGSHALPGVQYLSRYGVLQYARHVTGVVDSSGPLRATGEWSHGHTNWCCRLRLRALNSSPHAVQQPSHHGAASQLTEHSFPRATTPGVSARAVWMLRLLPRETTRRGGRAHKSNSCREPVEIDGQVVAL